VGRRANFRIQRELARANELHERAEVMRRAAMTPQQRAEADHVLHVQQVRETGETEARQRANQILVLGFIAGLIMASLTAMGWLFFVVLAGAAMWAWSAKRSRILALSEELQNMPTPWDEKRPASEA